MAQAYRVQQDRLGCYQRSPVPESLHIMLYKNVGVPQIREDGRPKLHSITHVRLVVRNVGLDFSDANPTPEESACTNQYYANW
jgi:hypothetical protein